MSATQLKEQIHSQVEKIQDESFLKVVRAMLDAYVQEQEDPIIGYDVEGNAWSASKAKEEFQKRIEAVENGNFTTTDEIRKQMQSW